MTVRIGVIGCGAVGRRRAGALAGATLTACVDVDPARARALAQPYGAQVLNRFEDVVQSRDVDVVVVSTTNSGLASVATAALEAGKHVLVEKPAARSVFEIDGIIAAAAKSKKLVRVVFNHRYHPALLQARRIVDAGTIGPLMFVRGHYGHGGRPGYESEWRADITQSGGGELIDQGVHLID